MSDQPGIGGHPFTAGFDFLKSLNKGQAGSLSGAAPWVAPTLDPQELDKRIAELKAVQFWLDQNAAALKATIQALEVQKMTLATLKGMNVDLSAMAQAFKFGAPASTPTPAPQAPVAKAAPAPAAAASQAGAASPDPMQLWGALTQQFQTLTANAMQEMSKQAAQVSAPAKFTSAKTTPTAASKKPAARKTAKRAGSGKSAG